MVVCLSCLFVCLFVSSGRPKNLGLITDFWHFRIQDVSGLPFAALVVHGSEISLAQLAPEKQTDFGSYWWYLQQQCSCLEDGTDHSNSSLTLVDLCSTGTELRSEGTSKDCLADQWAFAPLRPSVSISQTLPVTEWAAARVQGHRIALTFQPGSLNHLQSLQSFSGTQEMVITELPKVTQAHIRQNRAVFRHLLYPDAA